MRIIDYYPAGDEYETKQGPGSDIGISDGKAVFRLVASGSFCISTDRRTPAPAGISS